MLSLVEILKRISAHSQALVSPYTLGVQEKIIATYAAIGISCPAERHLGIRDNFTFGTVSEETIGTMISHCLAVSPDAVTILCTNMNGARVAAALEPPEGPMVLGSVAVTLWGCLKVIDAPSSLLGGLGRLFTDPRLD